MNWTEIWSDPTTYIMLYVLSVVIGIPTLRRMWSNVKAYSTEDIVTFYIIGVLLVLVSPITIVAYWLVWKLLLYSIFYRVLFCFGLYRLGNLIMPEQIRAGWKQRIRED